LHVPVLREEVLQFLEPEASEVIVDATLGGGGHAEAIADRIGEAGLLIGIDQDGDAIRRAEAKLEGRKNVIIRRCNFRQFDEVLNEVGIGKVHKFLFDLGVSRDQLDEGARGFSFLREGPLDMRMDQRTGERAADLVNTLPEEELRHIFFRFGEERYAGKIAARIVRMRREKSFEFTREFADVISAGVPRTGRIHPATKVFQALRIAVNRELEALEEGLNKAIRYLIPGGRVVVLSYHSLEDRIVKQMFRRESQAGRIRILTKKVVCPTAGEIAENPSSRSAKLRAAEKIA